MSVELIPHDDPYADIVFADPKPKHVDVWLDGPKADGVLPSHRLRECTEGTYLDYVAARGAGLKMDDGTITGVGAGTAGEAVLLSGCLFKLKNGGKTEEQVSIAGVRAMPSRIAEGLLARLKVISGISDLETAEQLRKRIAADTKKLEKLEAGRAGDTGPKDSLPGLQDTSGSARNEGAASASSFGGTDGTVP